MSHMSDFDDHPFALPKIGVSAWISAIFFTSEDKILGTNSSRFYN